MPYFLDYNGDLVGPPLEDHISFNLKDECREADASSKEELNLLAQTHISQVQSALTESLDELKNLIRQFHPIGILAHFAFYDLSYPDSNESEYQACSQHEVEVLQALILTIPEDEIQWNYPTAEQKMNVGALLRTLCTAFMLNNIDPISNIGSDFITDQMRSSTQAIRNAGFSDQIERNISELFKPLDKYLEIEQGITFSGLISIQRNIHNICEQRFRTLFKVFKEIQAEDSIQVKIDIYSRKMPYDEAFIIWLRDRVNKREVTGDEVVQVLLHHSEATHFSIFSWHLSEVLSVLPESQNQSSYLKAIEKWSHKQGSLSKENINHLFLNNPIWKSPLIKVNDNAYCSPIIGLLTSFGTEMLEIFVEGNKKIKDKYHDRRAKFLEGKVAKILEQAFPNAKIYKNIRWRDSDSKEGETDVLVLVDCNALIFECKGRRIEPSARRGGTESLKTALHDLIYAQTEQGARFTSVLKASKEPLEITDEAKNVHYINRGSIRRVTRINVLLDYLGNLATNYKMLIEAGLLKAPSAHAVTMSLVDLENIAWMLESPLELLHYLHRRAELEGVTQALGDELDWLACYLGGTFDSWERTKDRKLYIFLCSQVLEPYFLRRSLNVAKKVPKLRLSPWWIAILKRLEQEKPEGWTEMGIILLSLSVVEQEKLRRRAIKAADKMLKKRKDAEMAEYVGKRSSQGDETFVVGVLIFKGTRQLYADVKVDQALELLPDRIPEQLSLLLMVHAEELDAPYFRILIG